MPQYTPRTTRRSSEHTENLQRKQGGLEADTRDPGPDRTSKMSKLVCWSAKHFLDEFEQVSRDGLGDSDPWKEPCDLTPQPEDVVVTSPFVTHEYSFRCETRFTSVKNRKHIYNASAPTQDAELWPDWQRRVVEVVESFPCMLLLLAQDRLEMDSSKVRTVAAEIATENFDVSPAAGKQREVHWRALCSS